MEGGMARLADLFTEVREDYLDDTLGVDTDDALVTESQLVRFFDDAQKQACRRMDLLFDKTTAEICQFSLEDGKDDYQLDARITKLERVSIDGTDLTQTTEADLDREDQYWRTNSGTPTMFYVRQRTIYLTPIPDADMVGKTLDIEVYREPIEQIRSKGNDLEIPSEFHRDLIYWALHRIYNLRDEDLFDPNKAMYYGQRFAYVFGEEVPADVRIHQFENPRMKTIRPLEGYSYKAATSSDLDDDWE